MTYITTVFTVILRSLIKYIDPSEERISDEQLLN